MNVLFVAPQGYKNIGGMVLPIEQYLEAVRQIAQVDLVEVGYHPTSSDFSSLQFSKRDGEYEAVIVYGLNQAFGLSKYYLSRHKDIKKTAALLIDSESLYAYSMIKNSSSKDGFRYKAKMYLKKLLYNYKERYCLNAYRDVIYVSNVDKEFVERLFPKHVANISVIENGVSITERLPQKEHIYKALKLGFFSTFTPAVIEENLKPIVEELMPLVLNRYPEIKLLVAGRGMTKEVADYLSGYHYVEFIGPVKELSEFYSNIDVAVPITLKPNGILNKVLEAWANSKTVVAFDYNFYSFPDAKQGIHYLCGKDLIEVSNVIIEIINGRYDIDIIGSNARDLIENNYTWESKKKKLLKMLSI